MFYSPPPRQERAVRGEHRYPQVYRCSTQPSEKHLGRRPLKFFKNLRGARRAQERRHPCRSISKPEKFWKTAVRRSWPRGCSSPGRVGTARRPANHTTRPAPSRPKFPPLKRGYLFDITTIQGKENFRLLATLCPGVGAPDVGGEWVP